jgi:hypothetical protein
LSEEIGSGFKTAKHSSFSSFLEMMKTMIVKDRRLRKRVVALKEEIDMSQEQI